MKSKLNYTRKKYIDINTTDKIKTYVLKLNLTTKILNLHLHLNNNINGSSSKIS